MGQLPSISGNKFIYRFIYLIGTLTIKTSFCSWYNCSFISYLFCQCLRKSINLEQRAPQQHPESFVFLTFLRKLLFSLGLVHSLKFMVIRRFWLFCQESLTQCRLTVQGVLTISPLKFPVRELAVWSCRNSHLAAY